MRSTKQVFHLAIPCRDLDEAAEYYEKKLGCLVARRRHDRITLNFFGDQVVCHLAPTEIDKHPKMYPRHFGVTFSEKAEYDGLLDKVKKNNLPFFSEPFVRFEGEPAQHETFMLIDPSNNLIEFKWYQDKQMMY